MKPSRAGSAAFLICSALLLAICAGTNAYLAYRLNFPPRKLQVRIITDPSSPPGMLPENLKARVEELSGFFEQAAGVQLTVTGFTNLKLPPQAIDPDALRRYIDVRTPRDNADVLVAFWAAPQGDTRIGAAVPYSSIAVVRIDPGNPVTSKAILAHQLLTLFGVPASTDPQSVMFTPPTTLRLDPDSARDFSGARLFDFARGLGGMSRRVRGNVLDTLERYLRAHPPTDRTRTAHVVLAELLLRDSQFAASAEQYRQALRSDSQSVTGHLGLSLALTQAGEFSEAETEARTALKLAPGQGDTHYRLGYVLVRSGNPEAAIPELRKAIELQPKSIRNRTSLGVAYAASIGDFEAADHEFEEALKIDPQNPALLADIEYVSRLRARYSQQLEAAETYTRAHPENGPGHDRVALLSLRLGKVERSLSEAREALRLGPDTWHPHYTLALALYASHDFAGSAAALADAKRLGSGGRPFLEDALKLAAK